MSEAARWTCPHCARAISAWTANHRCVRGGPYTATRPADIKPWSVPAPSSLRAQLTEARRVLRIVQWVSTSEGTFCPFPSCRARKMAGHDPECALAKALEET